MILQSLADAYKRFEDDPEYALVKRGFSFQDISFVIVLEEDGTLFEIQDVREPSRKKPKIRVLGINKPSGSSLNPCFLWDNTSYLLGYSKKNSERALNANQETVKRYLSVEQEINDKGFSAVCRFLEKMNCTKGKTIEIAEDLLDTFGVFQIRGNTAYVHESPRIVEWWLNRTEADEEKMKTWWEPVPSRESMGWCLISGEYGPLARLHEPKVKGVKGQDRTGAVIVGSNQESFNSYGWEQAYNSPASKESVFAYLTALNTMLDESKRDRHRMEIGETTLLFWTDRPTTTEDIFARFIVDGEKIRDKAGQDEVLLRKIQAFLKALNVGRESYGDLDENPERTRYFLLGLSAPTPARITVRFFYQNTLSDLLTKLRQHFQDIKIVPNISEEKGKEVEYPSIKDIFEESCPHRKEATKKAPGTSNLEGSFLEAILTGKPYPDALYNSLLRRLKTEKVNYLKARIIKGYLIRKQKKEVSMGLDKDRKDPAYRLGRLFAALEKTQSDAYKQLNTTIRDHFYASASATPRSVFPRLLRTYQHHLSKLEAGQKVNREKLVQEILDPLTDFPAHLNLIDQGFFALGYYHQKQSFYLKREEEPSES